MSITSKPVTAHRDKFFFHSSDPDNSRTYFMLKANSQEGLIKVLFALSPDGFRSTTNTGEPLATIDPSVIDENYFEEVHTSHPTHKFANEWILQHSAGFINPSDGRIRDLRFAHMGNGLVCFDTRQEEHGDYAKVAQIMEDRSIKYYKDVGLFDCITIENKAAYSHPNISQSQEQKVFPTAPCKPLDLRKNKVIHKNSHGKWTFDILSSDNELISQNHKSLREALLSLEL